MLRLTGTPPPRSATSAANHATNQARTIARPRMGRLTGTPTSRPHHQSRASKNHRRPSNDHPDVHHSQPDPHPVAAEPDSPDPSQGEGTINRTLAHLLALTLAVLAAIAVVTTDGNTATKPTARIGKPAIHIHPSTVRPLNEIPYHFLGKVANKAIHAGHVYSHRWGDASPWLKALCYEMVDRAFSPYGTQAWARMVVNRESGCNPAAINSSSGTTGIAQIHPDYHTWVDFQRVQWDMRYAIKTFLRLSRNGSSTGPWCLC